MAAAVALGSNWLAAAASPSVACSADVGPRIVICHHTVEIYGRKEAFLASEISGLCELKFLNVFSNIRRRGHFVVLAEYVGVSQWPL